MTRSCAVCTITSHNVTDVTLPHAAEEPWREERESRQVERWLREMLWRSVVTAENGEKERGGRNEQGWEHSLPSANLNVWMHYWCCESMSFTRSVSVRIEESGQLLSGAPSAEMPSNSIRSRHWSEHYRSNPVPAALAAVRKANRDL